MNKLRLLDLYCQLKRK